MSVATHINLNNIQAIHKTKISKINEDTISFHEKIYSTGYENDLTENDENISSDKKEYYTIVRPCNLCTHDNQKDNTCIYCDYTHKCFSQRRLI